MKTSLLFLAALPLATFGAQARVGAPGSTPPPAGVAGTVEPRSLSAEQIRFALEEERVAHDLYVAASAKWSLPVFAQIAGAETQHAAALTAVASRMGVAPPPAQPGTYAHPDLQALYDQLRALLEESPTAALRVGALVEETDIADLRQLLATTTDPATLTVLGNLERASLRHLAAFVRQLAAAGVTYAPQVLTPSEFALVVQAGPGRGGARWGNRGSAAGAGDATAGCQTDCPNAQGWRGGR